MDIRMEHPDISQALRTGYPATIRDCRDPYRRGAGAVTDWDDYDYREPEPTAEQVCSFLDGKNSDPDIMGDFIQFVRDSIGMKCSLGEVLTDWADHFGTAEIMAELE